MSRKYVCPFCFLRIGELWFQCEGRGTQFRAGCTPEVYDDRKRLTGNDEPMLPSFKPSRLERLRFARRAQCPKCEGFSGRRSCPKCHTPLPINFGGSPSPFIAMVGGRGTGKTVYLTVLARELKTRLPSRFEADVHIAGDTYTGVDSPKAWLEGNVENMYGNGILAPMTQAAVDGRRNALVFEWRAKRRRLGIPTYPTSYLTFCDTAGEDLRNQRSTYELRYLGGADALILLLDPFMLPSARARLNLPPTAITSAESAIDVLSRVTETLKTHHGLGRNQLIPVPLAVAFAKMDEFFDDPHAEHVRRMAESDQPHYDNAVGASIHESVKSLLVDWNGGDIQRHLDLNYTTYRYFFVSALGSRPDYDNAVIRGTIQPYRVDEPLVWLLSHFDVVPVKGRA